MPNPQFAVCAILSLGTKQIKWKQIDLSQFDPYPAFAQMGLGFTSIGCGHWDQSANEIGGKQIRIQVSQQRTENKLFVLHNCTQWHLLMVGVVLPEILLGRIRRWPEGFIQNERLWCATRDEKLRRSGTYILLFFLFFFLVISNSISPNNNLKKRIHQK